MQQVRKILLKNSEPLGKNLKKTSGIFDSDCILSDSSRGWSKVANFWAEINLTLLVKHD